MGRRRNKARGRSMKESKTRVWFQAETKEQCAQDPPEEIFADVKPHTLCNEVNTICICSTKDDPSKDSATWEFRCGECSFKWSVVDNDEESDGTEDEKNNEIEDASVENEKTRLQRVGKPRGNASATNKRTRKANGETRKKTKSSCTSLFSCCLSLGKKRCFTLGVTIGHVVMWAFISLWV